jgi:membrane protein
MIKSGARMKTLERYPLMLAGVPAHGHPDAPGEGLARPMAMEAASHGSGSGRASSRPRRDRGRRLASAWRMGNQAFTAGRKRLEPTVAGRVWKQLSELRVVNSSLEFAAVFTLGFIPFLMVLSVALRSDLTRAVIVRGGFSAKAARDVAMLFTHGRTATTSLSILGLILAVVGGAAIAQMLQAWYAKIFRAEIHGWKARARRAEWLAGVFGFVALQVVIGRRIQPVGGLIAAASAQFLLAVVFWWWSLHCLLSGQVPWRRLFAAGLATAVCYLGLGVYIVYVMSSSIVSNEAMFGPIGAVFTLVTAEIGLAVALQLGAAIGAAIGRGKDPGGHRPADPGPDVSQPGADHGPAVPAHRTRHEETETDDGTS